MNNIDLINFEKLENEVITSIKSNTIHLCINIINDTIPKGIEYVFSNKYICKLSQLINEFNITSNRSKKLNGILKFEFENNLSQVDSTIFGLLVLFKNSYPNVRIEISLPKYTTEDYNLYHKVNSRLKSVFTFINLAYQEQFTNNLFEITNYNSFNDIKLTIPKRQFPIVLINEATYLELFEGSNYNWSITCKLEKEVNIDIINSIRSKIVNDKTSDTFAEKNYNAFVASINENADFFIFNSINKPFYFEFIKLNSRFNTLDFFFDRENNLIELPFLQFKTTWADKSEIIPIKGLFKTLLTEINKHPPFLAILFSYFLNRNLDKKEIHKNIDTYFQRINEIYEFSYSVFRGIKEIVRNIIEHTNSKTGVLCGRIYELEDLISIYDNQDFNLYKEELGIKKPMEEFLDLIILDEGQDGIINKTISNIENLLSISNGELNNILQEDVNKLKTKEITLKDFFNTKEIKLHHHSIRSASHWGLIIFANIIKNNNGFISASSIDNSDKSIINSCYSFNNHNIDGILNLNNFILGTRFRTILPLDKAHPHKKEILANNIIKDEEFSPNNYFNLLNYKYVNEYQVDEIILSNLNNNKNTQWLIEFKLEINSVSNLNEYRSEFLLADNIGKRIKATFQKNLIFIPVINLEEYIEYFDQSRLLRFLAKIQLTFNINNLIIKNVRTATLDSLQDAFSISSTNSKMYSFWNSMHFVLVYTYELNENNNKYYKSYILGGETINDFLQLNERAKGVKKMDLTISDSTIESIAQSPLFKKDVFCELQNFELVIKSNGKALFEINLESELNRDIFSVTDKNKIGYKISNTHFKLGSKTHINHFVYAKRIFQNSKYSDRFAYLVAKEFIEKNSVINNLTIIGYADYSQLLVNRIEKILKNYYSNKKIQVSINHDLVKDSDDVSFIKKEVINKNVLIVVPINTTFSTSIKIENLLLNPEGLYKIKDKNVTSYNLILVTHNNLDNKSYVEKLNEILVEPEKVDKLVLREFPYANFHWNKVLIDEKIVVVKTNPPLIRYTSQRYFITIPSEWSIPDECYNCFPEINPKNLNATVDIRLLEKPLLETDPTSVTPNLLLEIPENFKITKFHKRNDILTYLKNEELITVLDCVNESNTNSFFNQVFDTAFTKYGTEIQSRKSINVSPNSHFSSHIEHRGNHYLHFLDPTQFYKDYEEEVFQWATNIELILSKDIKINKSKIILIAPSDSENAYFIELINRIVFKDLALILYFDVNQDYLENYEKFSREFIEESDYIFFIDEFIQSGKTFHLLNDLICYFRKEKEFKNCQGVFTLINKTDNYCLGDISNQLNGNDNHFFSFFNWNDFHFSLSKCPLCSEQKKYKELAEISMLDSVRHYFLNKAKNLNKKTYTEIKEKRIENNILDINISRKEGWLKYNPFINENKINLLELATTNEWRFFKNNFPSKSYLKVIVQNSINHLISNNLTIRNEFEFFTTEQSNTLSIKQIIERKEELLEYVISALKEYDVLKGIFQNDDKLISKITDCIFKELVLKVFTQQPFINVFSIRQVVFSWIINELLFCINKMKGDGLNKKFDFKDFRYLKFLLRRITNLGSNFVISIKTLNDIRNIFSQYNGEIKLKIEQNRVLLYENISKKVSEITSNPTPKLEDEDMLQFLNQALRNIYYKDISLQEFGYFYVSLIKELTYNNDSKIIIIEKNIDDFFLGTNTSIKVCEEDYTNGSNRLINGEKDFFYILRLIKYENVGIIRKSIDIIVRDFIGKNFNKILFDNHCFEVRPIIMDAIINSLNHYSLDSLKKFYKIYNTLDTMKFLSSSECNQLVHLIYIKVAIENDLGKIDISKLDKPNNKSKSLIRNIYRLLVDNTTNIYDIDNYYLNNQEEIDNSNMFIPNAYVKFLDERKISENNLIPFVRDTEIKNPYYNDNENLGAFISVRFKQKQESNVDTNELMMLNTTNFSNPTSKNIPYNSIKKTHNLLNAKIDQESISYSMYNGLNRIRKLKTSLESENKSLVNNLYKFISNDYPSKPWSIFEISKKGSFWHSKRGDIYPFVKNNTLDVSFNPVSNFPEYFTEHSYIANEVNYYSFFRISDIKEQNNEIINVAKAVIGVYNCEGQIPIERLRQLLLLYPSLIDFFKAHFEKDSFSELKEVRNELNQAITFTHGDETALPYLQSLAIGTRDAKTDNEVHLIYNYFETGLKLSKHNTRYIEWLKNSEFDDLKNTFKYFNLQSSELSAFIADICKGIYKSNFYTTLEYNINPDINLNLSNYSFGFFKNIFELLFSEIFLNSKQRQEPLSKDTPRILKITSEIIDISDFRKAICFKIINNYSDSISDADKTIIEKNSFFSMHKGLKLINDIINLFGVKDSFKIKIDNNNRIFELNFTLYTY